MTKHINQRKHDRRELPEQPYNPPWWVRTVAPLRSHCWACSIWRGIILGGALGTIFGIIAIAIWSN